MTIGKVAAGIAAWINNTCLSDSESVPQVAIARIATGKIIIRTGMAKLKIRRALAHELMPI